MVALAFKHTHAMVGRDELDYHRGGRLVTARRKLAGSEDLRDEVAHLRKGRDFSLRFGCSKDGFQDIVIHFVDQARFRIGSGYVEDSEGEVTVSLLP